MKLINTSTLLLYQPVDDNYTVFNTQINIENFESYLIKILNKEKDGKYYVNITESTFVITYEDSIIEIKVFKDTFDNVVFTISKNISDSYSSRRLLDEFSKMSI